MILIVILLGLVIGSFLNVLIYRLPIEKEFVKSRSACPKCGHELSAFELIPVLSFVVQKGRCRSCQEKIALIYPIIELTNALVYALIYLKLGINIESAFYFLIASILIVILVIDYQHQIIPDGLNVTLLVIGILMLGLDFSMLGIVNKAAGFAIGGGLFLAIAVLSGGAMGGGDIKLMAVLGLILGTVGILMVTFFSFIIGAAMSLLLIFLKIKKMKDYIPFGPFIVLSAFVYLFFGNEIISLYINQF